MTLDLAQAAALHRRAVDAGMEGIVPPNGHPHYDIVRLAEGLLLESEARNA